jgi:hypothetical protein
LHLNIWATWVSRSVGKKRIVTGFYTFL